MMKSKNEGKLRLYHWIIVGGLLSFCWIFGSHATPIQITGVLIDEPCTIVATNGNINVEFGEIVDQDLYRSRIEQPFNIELEGCNSSLIKTLSVRFLGNTSNKQPGLLALDSSSQATGIAIGIESAGTLVPINDDTSIIFPFSNGSKTLTFDAYVQADPDAINTKSLGLGNFTATATFVFEYN